MAGGAGVEYYFGYRLAENDLVAEDFRSRDKTWDYCRIALNFFKDENIPFWEMQNEDKLVGNYQHNNDVYCLAKTSELYLVYHPDGKKAILNLNSTPGMFSVSWFNPREGGELKPGNKIVGGQSLVLTPPSENEDWLAVIKRIKN
jgi:hypothetical protein